MLKRVLAGLLCVVLISPLVGCKEEQIVGKFAKDHVIIGIKAEFEQEFREESFTVESFKWSNIERISYENWWSTLPEQHGWMMVYLKQHGEKEVLAAVKHLRKLKFVKDAKVSGIAWLD